AVPHTPQGPERRSVAVLPFRALSETLDHRFAAEAITDDVTVLLARVPGFFVIAKLSARAAGRNADDLRKVGRELGVQYLVLGNLRPAAEGVRLAVQLVEAETGIQLWAGRFPAPAEIPPAVYDDITHRIVGTIEPELTLAEMRLQRRSPRPHPDAWSH